MIHTRFMLLISLITIAVIYGFVFPTAKIINIILNEYIAIGIAFIFFIVYITFKSKLKGKLLYEYIPNLHYIPIKETIVFFVLFQCYDYYNENGFIGMISLWFMYWIFGICANLGIHSLNLYKNLKAYKLANLETKA